MGRTSRAFGLGGVWVLLLAPAAAHAQFPAPRAANVPMAGQAAGGDPISPTRGMATLNANPFANPYVNPFMNPYAGGSLGPNAVPPGQAALYFFAAQQANGGIGSGRLSGVHPDPAVAAARGQAAAPTGERRRVDSNTPGATASRYFNRSVDTQVGVRRSFNRQNGQFPSSRRGR